MQFTKWVRKNRQTIMVAVLILCMITFVGGVGFTELLKYLGHGRKVTIATYDNGKKINSDDMMNARQELEVLDAVEADVVLFNKPTVWGSMDVNSQLLGYLLFGSSQSGAQIRSKIRQAASRGQIPVTTAQIDEYFNQTMERPEIMWILLTAETAKAGITVSNAQSAAMLKELIPQITGNRYSAAQVISGIASQMNLTSDQILAIYGKMLGVLKWADYVCNNENATLTQVGSIIGHNKSKIDADFVKFPADWFIDKQPVPNDEQIRTQFNAYKDIHPGQYTEQNPCGFGYKLPKRVQLEYFYVRNDDVKKIAEKPTADAMESYYANNIDQFTDSRPKDPNKPDGEKITETKSFAEVSDQIRRTIEQQNTEKLTQLIFKDAKDMLDADLISLDMEKATAEQIRKAAVDFATAAAKITAKWNVPIQTGKTGLLSAADFGKDNGLTSLRLNQGGIQTSLLDAVFAIDPQNTATPHKVGIYIPRIWENLGPINGMFYSEKDYTSTSITIICRVIDVRPSETPADIDVAYSIAGLMPSDSKNKEKDDVFNLKQTIIEDLKKTSALDAAKAAAEELKQLIAQSDWDKAMNKYNTAHAPADPNNLPEKAFKKLEITSVKQQLLASASDIEQFRRMMQDNPAIARYIQDRMVSNMLNQKLLNLLADKSATGIISEIVEHKPAMAFYLVKSVTRQSATTEDYTENKPYAAMRIAMDSSSGLGLIHFDPAQIQKRMNLSMVKQEDITAAAETEEAAVKE